MMPSLFQRLNTTIAPEITRPDPAKVISGDPVQSTWNWDEGGGLHVGIWTCTPGKWRLTYEEWEYCHILSGVSVLTHDDGTAQTLTAGDSFVIRPGFSGTWEVIETTTKDYVIRL